MAEKQKDYGSIVNQREKSQLKVDLNRGIAALVKASEVHFQPHICLNDFDGVKTILEIARDPDGSDTSIRISAQLNYGGHDGVWLNIYFWVMLPGKNDEWRRPLNLSPRQTSFIVANLSPDSKSAVLEKVKDWYFLYFMKQMESGLKIISYQFEAGKMLVGGTSENRIFDIHLKDKDGKLQGHEAVLYTESDIIGDALFWKIFYGYTVFHNREEGASYQRVDELLTELDYEKKATADATIGLIRALHKLDISK